MVILNYHRISLQFWRKNYCVDERFNQYEKGHFWPFLHERIAKTFITTQYAIYRRNNRSLTGSISEPLTGNIHTIQCGFRIGISGVFRILTTHQPNCDESSSPPTNLGKILFRQNNNQSQPFYKLISFKKKLQNHYFPLCNTAIRDDLLFSILPRHYF